MTRRTVHRSSRAHLTAPGMAFLALCTPQRLRHARKPRAAAHSAPGTIPQYANSPNVSADPRAAKTNTGLRPSASDASPRAVMTRQLTTPTSNEYRPAQRYPLPHCDGACDLPNSFVPASRALIWFAVQFPLPLQLKQPSVPVPATVRLCSRQAWTTAVSVPPPPACGGAVLADLDVQSGHHGGPAQCVRA